MLQVIEIISREKHEHVNISADNTRVIWWPGDRDQS